LLLCLLVLAHHGEALPGIKRLVQHWLREDDCHLQGTGMQLSVRLLEGFLQVGLRAGTAH